jgi:hypothetical protein
MKDDLLTAVDRFTAAMTRLSTAKIDLSPLRRFTTASLTMRRERWGGMRADAHAFPEQWQSSVCAGLLCTVVVCPSDAHNLQCHHSCHGGAR